MISLTTPICSYHVDSSIRIVSLEELKAVVDEVARDDEGKVMLREDMMALVSPRVFWAFRLHFPGRAVHDVLRNGEASEKVRATPSIHIGVISTANASIASR